MNGFLGKGPGETRSLASKEWVSPENSVPRYDAVTAPLIWPLIRYLPMKM